MPRLFSGLFLYIVVACALNENLIMKTGIELIAEERQRQIEKEGWTAKHDAEHTNGEIAKAAAVYALPSKERSDWTNAFWVWDIKWFKPTPKNRIRELQKAGALIAAEIDRLNAL